MRKIASLAMVAALVAFVGTASAEQPVQLTDDQMDHVTAGGFGFVDVELIVTAFKDVFENVNKFINKDINVDVDVNGFSTNTCLPACNACMANSKWLETGVEMAIASTLLSASSSR